MPRLHVLFVIATCHFNVDFHFFAGGVNVA